jgi:hypothetical protein
MKLVTSGLLSLKFCDIENFAIFPITVSKLVEFTLEFFFNFKKFPIFYPPQKKTNKKTKIVQKKPKKMLGIHLE